MYQYEAQPVTNGSGPPTGQQPELVAEAPNDQGAALGAESAVPEGSTSSRPPSVAAQNNHFNQNTYYDYELGQWVQNNAEDQAGQRLTSGPDLIPNHDGEVPEQESVKEPVAPQILNQGKFQNFNEKNFFFSIWIWEKMHKA